VLRQVNLEILAGESVGLCGPTGGGKSTLVDILAGLLEPTSGRVMADGLDIHQDVRQWQRRIGFVSQDMYLFDDTLLRNIALGVPDDSIDEAAVRWAVEMAQLDEFVAKLPKGLETEVGEHGTLLSGGQRQRVAIARAIYRDPDILFLDEGTSALDNETERHFIEALQRFQGKKTLILVAHRLSTIRNCDRVYFVDNGRVSGGGSYDELYEENSAFRRMAV
jgi:ATP-binding cassette, subfamily B, bacterial PglK